MKPPFFVAGAMSARFSDARSRRRSALSERSRRDFDRQAAKAAYPVTAAPPRFPRHARSQPRDVVDRVARRNELEDGAQS